MKILEIIFSIYSISFFLNFFNYFWHFFSIFIHKNSYFSLKNLQKPKKSQLNYHSQSLVSCRAGILSWQWHMMMLEDHFDVAFVCDVIGMDCCDGKMLRWMWVMQASFVFMVNESKMLNDGKEMERINEWRVLGWILRFYGVFIESLQKSCKIW